MAGTRPGRYPIYVKQGDRHTESLVFEDSDENPFNLTGYSAVLAVRANRLSKNKNTVLVTWTTEGANPQITLGGALGTIEVVVPASQTLAYDFTQAEYDLFLYTNEDNTIPLLYGPFVVNPTQTEISDD